MTNHISKCSGLSCHLPNRPCFFVDRTSNDPKDYLIFFVYQESMKTYIGLFISVENLSDRRLLQMTLSQVQEETPQEWVDRAIFEASIIEHLPQISSSPTCFICFNVSEKKVGEFLRKKLVPDLEMAGFKTHFCFRDLKLGDDLYKFMENAYHADMVIIICTPALRKKVKERVVGVTYEIERLIIPRIEARGIDKTNIFPVYYSGSRQESCPAPGLLSIFSTKLLTDSDDQWETNYFANAFQLFATMRGMGREEAFNIVSSWRDKRNTSLSELETKKSKTIEIKREQIDTVINYYEKNSEEKLRTALRSLYSAKETLPIFRVKGEQEWEFKLPLEEMYVRLGIIERSEGKVRDQTLDKHSTYLQDERISTYETIFKPKKKLKLEKLFEHESLQRKERKRVYIQGAAGSGKSTLCHYIAYRWAQKKLWQDTFSHLFWIPLRNLTLKKYPEAKEYSAIELIAREYSNKIGFNLLESCIKDRTFCSKTLLILDGYDELAAGAQGNTSLGKAFKELTELFPHILITSRPGSCSYTRSCDLELLGFDQKGVNHYIDKFFHQVQAEEKKGKLQQLLKSSPYASSLARIPINLTLLCSLFHEDPTVLESSSSITMSFIYDRIVNWLYKWFMLRRIERSESEQTKEEILEEENLRCNPEVANIAAALEEMAYSAMEEDTLYLDRRQIDNFRGNKISSKELRDLGLLRISEGKGYFIHLTFQEFLTASKIANHYFNGKKGRDFARNFVRKYKFDPRYTLIFSMIAGYLSLSAATDSHYGKALQSFFDDLFSEPYDLAVSNELNLLASCFEECQNPAQIKQYSGFIGVVKEYIRELTSLRLDFRLLDRREKLLNQPEVVDTIIELVAQPKTTKGMLENLSKREVAGQRLAPKLVSAIVNVLKMKEGDNYAKSSAAEALGEVAKQGSELPKEALAGLIALLKEGNYFAKRSAAYALGEVAKQEGELPKEALAGLMELLKEGDSDVKISAATVLGEVAKQGGELPKEILARLMELLKEGDTFDAKRSAGIGSRRFGIKITLATVLGEVAKQGGELAKEVLAGLIKLLEEGDFNAKGSAATVLGEVAKQGGEFPKEALTGLMKLLEEGDFNAKGSAATVLGEVAKQGGELPKEILARLMELLKEGDNDAKSSAAAALGEVAKQGGELPKEALAGLMELFREGDSDVKISAATALGEVAKQGGRLSKESVDALIQSLHKGDFYDKSCAAAALVDIVQQGGHLPKEAVDIFIQSLNQTGFNFIIAKSSAAAALGEVAKQGVELSKEVLAGLIGLLKEGDNNAKSSAAAALGEVAKQGGEFPKEALTGLMKLLKEGDLYAERSAAIALGEVAKQRGELAKEALAGLIGLLKEGDNNAKSSAATALGEVAKQRGELAKEALAGLIGLLKEGDLYAKSSAATALGEVAKQGVELPKEVLAGLIGLLKEGDLYAKRSAATALGEVAKQGVELPKEALAGLIKLLKEGDLYAKRSAVAVLRKINKNVLLKIGVKAIPLIAETCFFIENSFSINDQQFQISDQRIIYPFKIETKLCYEDIREKLPNTLAKWRKQLDGFTLKSKNKAYERNHFK